MKREATSPPRRTPVAAAPYQVVKQHLKTGLEHGRWKPGTLMPSESALVTQFGVSRMTVNRALRELQSEGLVERVQGVGTFAAQLHKLSATLSIRDMREHVESRGLPYRMGVHLLREESAPPMVAQRFGLKEGTPVFHSLAVHYEGDVPLQCEDRWVNPAAAPHYLSTDFSASTPTQYLLEVAPTWEASYTIEATMPSRQEARLLKIDATEPCLVVTRSTVSRGTPVTLVRLVHPGSRYLLEGRFQP
ncbi:histidine utilization repressor [Thiomonas sp. FB-6]|uniref:histidine utilization repressor n=1 Tax=Thiomonas sp. FB-6 TaxID=1158291 RepID=UPI00039EE212|nr:histidine utilization repressor [Thiomonas sp. FB-6]